MAVCFCGQGRAARFHHRRRHVCTQLVASSPAQLTLLCGELDCRYSDFVDRELIQFSRADLVRSIPSVVDGLKPSQRKVLFACFKRGLTQEIKVAQLAGCERLSAVPTCAVNGRY